MAKLKPYCCKECGETKPAKFHQGNKSLCKKHYTKKYQRASADIPPPTMTAEDREEFDKKCTEAMKENLRLRREVLYGL